MPAEQTTWIALRLVDGDGAPVPNRPYVVTLPNGTTRAGCLDANGKARIDGLDPGKCVVSFPDFHETDYGPVTPLPGQRSPDQRGPALQDADDADDTPSTPPDAPVSPNTLSFCIVDQNGAPLPGVRYELTSPSGQPLSGTVDGTGSAVLDGVEPGSYNLTLPDVEAGAWSVADASSQ